MKPTLIMVGADKGGVGKTTVARSLLDFLASNNVIVRAFDTETPRGTLHRFHPEITQVVDINQTPDQMRILDTLNTSQVKVTLIDTRAGARPRASRRFAMSAFSMRRRPVSSTSFSSTSLGRRSHRCRKSTKPRPMSRTHYFLVKNYVNDFDVL